MNNEMVFLVVDDTEGMRRILTNCLNRMGKVDPEFETVI